MMINVLSLGDAVAGGAPSSSLNDLTSVAEDMADFDFESKAMDV